MGKGCGTFLAIKCHDNAWAAFCDTRDIEKGHDKSCCQSALGGQKQQHCCFEMRNNEREAK